MLSHLSSLLLLVLSPAGCSICVSRFVEYIPSQFEATWVANVRLWENKLTEVCKKEMNKNIFHLWITELHANRLANHDVHYNQEVFSRFIYEKFCEGGRINETVYIEPLAGLTRHPYFILEGDSYVVNKEYMLVNNTFARELIHKRREETQFSHERRFLYFDFGASEYNDGPGGASQSWFVDQYEMVNITFDDIYAFEGQSYEPNKIFEQIPERLLSHYHWYNVFVSDSPDSHLNAVHFITSIAKPSDFVLVKLDIDNNPVERGI